MITIKINHNIDFNSILNIVLNKENLIYYSIPVSSQFCEDE